MPQQKLKSDLLHEQRSDIYISKSNSKAEKTEIDRLGFTAFYGKHPDKFKEINNSVDFSNQHEKPLGAVDFHEKKGAQRYTYTGDSLSSGEEIDEIDKKFLRFRKNIDKLKSVYNLVRDTVKGMEHGHILGYDAKIPTDKIEDYKEIVSGVFSHIESNEDFSGEIGDLLGSHLALMHDIMTSKRFGEQSDEYKQKKIQDMQNGENNIDNSITGFQSIFEQMKNHCNREISSVQNVLSLIKFHAELKKKYKELEVAFNSINMARSSIEKIIDEL